MSQDVDQVEFLWTFMPASGTSEAELSLSLEQGFANPLASSGQGQASLNPTYATLIAGLLETEGSSAVEAFFRTNDEPNVFGSGSTAGSSSASMSVQSAMDVYMRSDGSSQASLNLQQSGNAEANRLRVVFTGIPPRTTSRYLQYNCRLTINGTETKIPIKAFTVRKSALSIDVSFTLANLNAINTVLEAETFKFEIAETTLGATTWKTIFDTYELDASTYTMGWAERSPNDTFVFSILSGLSARLNQTPLTDLTLFDPLRTDFNVDAQDSFYSVSGHQYAPIALQFSNMRLHDLFQEILVERCGFGNFVSNLGNAPIRIATFPMTQTFWEALKGFIGMYRVAFRVVGNTIYLIDKTLALPAGFPAPRTIRAKNYKTVSRTIQKSRVEALRLLYSLSETEALYYVERNEPLETNDLGNGFSEEISRSFFDYYATAFPGLKVKTVPDTFEQKTYEGVIETGRINERYVYNSSGRLSQSVKRTQLHMPTVAVGGVINLPVVYSLQEVEEQTTTVTWESHPFKPFRVYPKKTVTEIVGRYAIDEDNQYLGESFRQSLVEAHRAGNLKEGMIIGQGRLKTIIATLEPQRDGTERPSVRVIDHLRSGIPISNPSSDTVGDSSLSAASGEGKLLVMANDGNITTGKQIEDYHIGETPLYIGLPLAKRELDFRQNKQGTITSELMGLDLNLEDGSVIRLEYPTRTGLAATNLIVQSISIQGSNLGTLAERYQMNIEAERI